MTRLDIFKLLTGVSEIIGKPEVKSILSPKDIYSLAKLNGKLRSINNKTGDQQNAIKDAMLEASNGEGVTDEQKEEIQKKFNEDWQSIWHQDVESPVQVKYHFASAEKMIQHISGAEVTECFVEQLVEEPPAELKAV